MDYSALTLHGLLNLCVCDHAHNLHLICYLLQHVPYVAVALHKPKFGIVQSLLFCEFFYKNARFAKIVAWQTREEVVRDLKMKTAVYEFDDGGADHVNRSAKLPRGERFRDTHVGGGTRKV